MTFEVKSYDDFKDRIYNNSKLFKVVMLTRPQCLICKQIRKKLVSFESEEKYDQTDFFTSCVGDVPGLYKI